MKITIHYPHGPDLLLNLDGEVLVLPADSTYDQSITISGVIETGAIPLTIQRAESLAADLLNMCQEARELSIDSSKKDQPFQIGRVRWGCQCWKCRAPLDPMRENCPDCGIHQDQITEALKRG